MAPRKARLTFFIGTNGTGKSTAQKQFLAVNKRNLVFPSSSIDTIWNEFEKIQPEKRVIEDPKALPGKVKQKVVYRIPNINAYTGTRIVDESSIQSEDDVIDLMKSAISVKHGFKKGGLFLDDFKNLIKTNGTLGYELRKLLSIMRHIEVDIFMATHGFREINYQFFQHDPVFYIFKSDSPPGDKVKKQYGSYNELMEVYDEVQEMAKTNPYACLRYPRQTNTYKK